MPPHDRLLEMVAEAWRKPSDLYLRMYEGVGPVTTLMDRQDLLNAAFGLARFSS